VEGSRGVDGVRVGYPQSVAGAVSAAVEYWTRLGSTLDPDEARRIGRRVAVRSWKTAGDDLAKGTANTRRQFGLPGTGVLPPEAMVSLGPVAYQLRDRSPGRVTVLLLGYLITTMPSAGTQTRLGVFPAVMRFDAGDWRVAKDSDGADYRSLQAPPGSAQARAAGWLDEHPRGPTRKTDRATRTAGGWSSALDHRYIKSGKYAGLLCPRGDLNPHLYHL
jgi:hypothetical protein